MTDDDTHRWHVIASEEALTTPWLTVLRNDYRRPDGTAVHDLYVTRRRDFAIVVARQGDNVLLVHQYRHAIDQMEWSLPAGGVDPGETPRAAAERELLEETGYQGERWQALGAIHPSPGYITHTGHVFTCEVVGEPVPVADPHEIVAVQSVLWSEAVRMAVTGTITDGNALAALFLAEHGGGQAATRQ